MIYRAYGLVLAADRAISGLPPVGGDARPDLRVWFGRTPDGVGRPSPDAPWYVSPFLDEAGNPIFTGRRLAGGAFLEFHYSDGTNFIVSRAVDEVWATWVDPLTFSDTVSYFLGPVLGIILRLRGVLCLHASAIDVDGTAAAFIGHAGAGKSTTAAAFAELGFPVLSDDVLPLSENGGTWQAVPGYPRLRLWPSSVDLIADISPAFPRLPPDWNMDRRYHVDFARHTYRFAEQPVELGSLYLLDEPSDDPAAPSIEAMTPAAALMALVPNTYVPRMLDRALRAREFDQLGRLVERVEMRRIRRHRDPASLPRMCELIVEDVKRGQRAAAAMPVAKR